MDSRKLSMKYHKNTAMLLTSKCQTEGHHNSLNTLIDSIAKMVANLWTIKVEGPKKAN